MTESKINRHQPPPRAGEDPPAPALVRAVVARGNTIEVPTGERYVAGYSGEGKDREPVYAQRCRSVGPGREVELPADEVARLTEAGSLVDPGALAGDGREYPNRAGPEY
jgi:hypothetical protein